MKRGKFLAGVFFCMLLGCLMIVSCNDSAIVLLFAPDRVEITQRIDSRPVHVLMGEAIGDAIR